MRKSSGSKFGFATMSICKRMKSSKSELQNENDLKSLNSVLWTGHNGSE